MRSSIFCGPVVVPIRADFERFQLEVRVPLWFSFVRADGPDELRPMLILPTIALSFGARILKP